MSTSFESRHIGPSLNERSEMLKVVGAATIETLIAETIPNSIRTKSALKLDFNAFTEREVLDHMRTLSEKNELHRTYLGMGYSGTLLPSVIQRNVLENAGWYTQYTPYQAEIAQGRLEALLNFQTLITDLTGLEISNASLLDEATAAAEAMVMAHAIAKPLSTGEKAKIFFADDRVHPQTLAVLKTRAEAIGLTLEVGELEKITPSERWFGYLVQYPDTRGEIRDYKKFTASAHDQNGVVIVACDLLSLTLLASPGEWGADIAVGSAQRFGVPMGYGGPHAAFLSTRDAHKRLMPGRIVGVSKDAQGRPAIRLALQTREQHIRRDKATSNICTAQVLLAVIASFYAVYHGPKGLKEIALTIRRQTATLAKLVAELSGGKLTVATKNFFDTLTINGSASDIAEVWMRANAKKINLRKLGETTLGVSLDETVTDADLKDLAFVFSGQKNGNTTLVSAPELATFERKTAYLTHPVFHQYQSEHELLRYIYRLQNKDLSLTHSMIPLGSCTMKLNAATEMLPITWPKWSNLHPFAPLTQARGYGEMIEHLEKLLCEITGFDACSLQPNAGSQGEYAGLLAIREYLISKNQASRKICLIPQSAHGTNPASAVMAGFQVVVVQCDREGNVDLSDLKAKAEAHRDTLGALMITYPSTHGVFEEAVQQICEIVHGYGGQVYMDGANMNAQVALCRPGDFGPDVCHLNLHKTFCIPHGGGGPGMGPICVKSHLAEFLPGHPVVEIGRKGPPVSAAPFGSALILPISYSYILMMGEKGLKAATETAILNANYMAKRLNPAYPVLYRGKNERIAHECIIDLRQFKASAGVEVEDVAKRLMDYGFHAPTVSFPVSGTLMIEPTESESKAEMDRFCDAMLSIREEIREIENGKMDRTNNPLKNAPHPAEELLSDRWDKPYTRARAAYPLPWVKERKFWMPVSRIDGVYGDRNLFCTCPPVENT